jgi:hypothetical protein
MKAKRTFTLAVFTLAGAVALCGIAAFCPPVQTWAARRVLASAAGPGASLEAASAGWGRVSITGLRLDVGGAVLMVPSADARVDVLPACLGRRLTLTSLVAKGWTLDLTQPSQGAPRAGAGAAAPEGAPWARQLVGGAFTAFNVPARASLDGVDLEGTAILSDGRGHPIGNARVVVTGGGLSPGRDGSFQCSLAAALDDKAAAVSSLRVLGTLTASMDETGAFTRAGLKMDATATGRKFPGGIGLAGSASASRGAGSVSYSFSLERGDEQVAALDARSAGSPMRIAGAWRLNLKDTDLAPFALGRALPEFDAAGDGRYEVDAATGDVHALGNLGVSAANLGVVSVDLASIGRVEVVANFDVARVGDSLRVDRLEARISGASPVASVLALQPFEFNPATGELKVARPTGDLVGISVTGLPLSWFRGPLPWVEAAGGDLRGEFAMRAEDGRLALRTKAPLAASDVSLSGGGRQVANGLDLSAFILADYAPKGWQVQLSPFKVRSAGVGLLTLEARFGRLAGAGEPVKVEGSWDLSLQSLLAQPVALRLPGLAGGDASGSLAASLGATREVRLKVALTDLVPAPGAGPLPSASADISADFDAQGPTTFVIPLHLAYESRAADMVLSGTVTADERGRVVNAALSGGSLALDDIGALALICGARPGGQEGERPAGDPAPAGERARGPFWPPGRARISLQVASLALPGFSLGDVRGTVGVEPDSLSIDAGSASLGGDSTARVTGKVSFAPGAGKPYSLQATVAVGSLDSGPIFRAINPDEPPTVEGRFDLSGQLSASGDGVRGLVDAIQGDCRLSSRSGVFRALRTGAIEPLRQNQSKIEGALDSVTSLFGKKADKAFDAVIDSAEGLSEIHYDQMTLLASRGADLDLRLTEISLIAPEEHLTGTATVTHVEGVAMGGQPLSADLQLGVRGKLEALLGIVGMLREDGQDGLGYSELYQSIHLGGTLRDIDQGQWRDMLVRAPLRKAGGLFDKLLGR